MACEIVMYIDFGIFFIKLTYWDRRFGFIIENIFFSVSF